MWEGDLQDYSSMPSVADAVSVLSGDPCPYTSVRTSSISNHQYLLLIVWVLFLAPAAHSTYATGQKCWGNNAHEEEPSASD